MVILFTGMSGVDIKESLNKFKTEFNEFKIKHPEREPEIIEFETELEKYYYSVNQNIPKSNQVWKDEILTLPYVILEGYWKETFNLVYKKIQTIKNEYIFLVLHSCYYHNKTHGYLSLINLEEIKKLEIKIVVTFIDDIYEVHHRLTKLGGLFHDDKLPSKTSLILRHIMLLDWRSKETMLTRFISKQFSDCKHYVFAIKHSFETLSNLIYDNMPSAYVSHPITEVRRLEKRHEIEEADKIKKEITQISNFLSSEFVPFLPTTIDEYRIDFESKKIIEKGKPAESKKYFPVLRKRWEEDWYKRPSNLLYINSGFTDLNELWGNKRSKTFDEPINQLLTALADIISDQVSVRDYALIEQSEVLVIYRPLFNGNASGGVLEEFHYFLSLKKIGINMPYCFIYCPQDDIEKFYCREFKQKIIKEIDELKHFTYLGKVRFDDLLQSEKQKLITANRNKNLIKDILDEILNRCQIAISENNSKTPLSKDELKEYKNKFVKELSDSFEIVDDYRNPDNTDVFENNFLPVHEFIKNISLFLTQN